MSSYRFGRNVYTMWGNENAKFANDEVLYHSEQVIIVKFRMLVTDPFFNFVEVHAQSITQITDNTFEYIHKVNDLYYYMGEIQRLKITKIVSGVAEMEIVILKHNEGSIESVWGKIGKFYPCKTKKDVCYMRNLPFRDEQKINKVILHCI
jgi:hypothetical protein